MAFSHHKIVISDAQPAAAAVAYLADPQAQSAAYYSEVNRAPMAWAASKRAREQLGLGDRVALWKVERLLRGQHPISGDLLRRWGPNQTMVGAIDVTLSPAPKSLSILWALAPPKLREEIELMVVEAVAGAIGVMTENRPLVRERYGPGKNDVRAIKANDVVGLQVLHTTARLNETRPGIPDPQLHVHSLLFADLREDGRLRAIESLYILQHRAELDARARATLAAKLQRAGFQIERKLVLDSKGRVKRTDWDVKGIPESLKKAMSGRSQEIEDLIREYQETTGREARGVGWEHFVSNRRGPKSKLSAEELTGAWWTEAQEHGLNREAVQALIDQAEVEAREWSPPGEDSPEAEQLRQEILRDLCRNHALVPIRELHALTQQRAIGLLDPYTAGRVVARLFGSGDLLRTEDDKVTTLEVLAQEQRAERALRRIQERQASQAAEQERVQSEFDKAEEEGRPFDDGQKAAIALALSGVNFVSICGPAGTGKGFTSRPIVDVWREQGRQTYALAVAGRTAQQAGHDSGAVPMTIDSFVARVNQVGGAAKYRHAALIVDEAAMIDHHRYAGLLEAAANAQATLVQIGDDEQLSPVGPGGLWTIFHALAEQRGHATELRQIHRARNALEAQAWTDLREGRTEQALTWYRDVGQLRLYDTRQELRQGMVTEWWARNPEGVMLVDTSNAERDVLNQLAQARRLEAGELGSEVFQLASGLEIRAGDRVIFADQPQDLARDLNPFGGRRVENGTEATVHRITLGASSVQVELQEPAGSRLVHIGPEAELELGYARHLVKGQGMTIENSHDVAVSEQTGKEGLYVLASRSREGTRIHALKAELEEMEVDVHELETAPRVEVEADPELQEIPLTPEPETGSVRMFNEAELRPGQVVSFGEQLPLREPSGVELGELGVVKSIHRGGLTWDFARVELVGGRQVSVYQADLVEPVPDVEPAAVYDQPATVAQRNPDSSINLPLANGVIVQRGDLVRFTETQAQGRVIDVQRSPSVPASRGLIELAHDGERVPLFGTSNVEVVKTAQEIAAEHVQQVEQATIEGLARQVGRSQKERAVGDRKMEPGQESEAGELTLQASDSQVDLGRQRERGIEVRRDRDPAQREIEPQPEPDHEAIGRAIEQAGREPLAAEAYGVQQLDRETQPQEPTTEVQPVQEAGQLDLDLEAQPVPPTPSEAPLSRREAQLQQAQAHMQQQAAEHAAGHQPETQAQAELSHA